MADNSRIANVTFYLSLLFGSCHPFNPEQEPKSRDGNAEASVLTTEPELAHENLDSLLQECGRQAWWDQYHLAKLGEKSTQDRVTMFALFSGENSGDVRDGEFIAKLLPLYKKAGWNYVALEADQRLNKYSGTAQLEAEFRAVHGDHWLTYAPVVHKARELGMEVVFYDAPLRDTASGEEIDYSLIRGEAQFSRIKPIFDKDVQARVITIGGVGHASNHPVEKSWLEQEKVNPLGMFLNDYVGMPKITRVMLQSEKPSILWVQFDSSFYLGKSCPEGIEPVVPEISPELRKFGVF